MKKWGTIPMEARSYRLITYVKDLDKFFSKVDQKTRDQIMKALYELKTYPHVGDIKKMKGGAGYRKRVKDYRILFDIDHDKKEIYVYEVFHRQKDYKK